MSELERENYLDNRLGFVAHELEALSGFESAYDDSRKDRTAARDHGSVRAAVRLIFEEKEILVFALLQWLAVGLAYLVWVQMLGWIPMEVWESDSDIYNLGVNLALLGWSVLCVGLTAFPVGILTGAMGAAHLLRSQGRASTLAACLQLSMRSAWSLWLFHWLDGWITVDRILERLPKRGYGQSLARLAATELLYFAWKVGIMGVTPAVLTGKNLLEAGKSSVRFVKARLGRVVLLRGAYTAVNWIVGIGAYVGGLMFIFSVDAFDAPHSLYSFYLWAAAPIVIAVGVLQLFVRPIFILAACNEYAEYLRQTGETVELPDAPAPATSAAVAFVILMIFAALIFVFRNEIGLMKILAVE